MTLWRYALRGPPRQPCRSASGLGAFLEGVTACAVALLRGAQGSQADSSHLAEGKADVIVSGDEDLLALKPFEGILIIPAASFLRLLETPPAG